jgi:hypothetical protein
MPIVSITAGILVNRVSWSAVIMLVLKVNNEIACCSLYECDTVFDLVRRVIHYLVEQDLDAAGTLMWLCVLATTAAHTSGLTAINFIYVS